MLGAPLALSLGVPLGTWLGGLLGWRWAFGLLSLTALLLVGWVLRSVPDFPGQPAGRRLRLLGAAHAGRASGIAGDRRLGAGAQHPLPISRRSSPRSAWAPRWTWPCWYSAARGGGIWLVGVLVDRHLRRMVLASLALFAVAALALCLGARWSWLAFAGLALWGLTFGGAATLLQNRLGGRAPGSADLAQSMIVVAWNLAIAGGGRWVAWCCSAGAARCCPGPCYR